MSSLEKTHVITYGPLKTRTFLSHDLYTNISFSFIESLLLVEALVVYIHRHVNVFTQMHLLDVLNIFKTLVLITLIRKCKKKILHIHPGTLYLETEIIKGKYKTSLKGNIKTLIVDFFFSNPADTWIGST